MQHKTVGIVGAGRIGSAYARMMCEGHKCNIIYHDLYQNKHLEEYIADYSKFLESKGETGVTCTKVDTVEELLQTADVGLPCMIPSISSPLACCISQRPHHAGTFACNVQPELIPCAICMSFVRDLKSSSHRRLSVCTVI